MLALSKSQIERFAKVFIPRKLILLAEKVETHEMFQYCKDLGYELFQGYFLTKPQIIEGKAISDNKMVVLNLIRDLQDPNISVTSMTKTLSQDPQMSYKLLKLVNSAAFARVEKCTSLQTAIAMLGRNHIRSWANLLALGNLDDKPVALKQSSLERAILCEKLGEKVGHYQAHEYCTVGLFSLLAAYLDRPMFEIMKSLNLPETMEMAILSEDGPLGLILHTAKCFQQAKLHELKLETLAGHNLDLNTMEQLYKESLIESDEQISASE